MESESRSRWRAVSTANGFFFLRSWACALGEVAPPTDHGERKHAVEGLFQRPTAFPFSDHGHAPSARSLHRQTMKSVHLRCGTARHPLLERDERNVKSSAGGFGLRWFSSTAFLRDGREKETPHALRELGKKNPSSPKLAAHWRRSRTLTKIRAQRAILTKLRHARPTPHSRATARRT